MKTLDMYVLFQNRATAETLDSSHVLEISLPVLSVAVFLHIAVWIVALLLCSSLRKVVLSVTQCWLNAAVALDYL